MVDLSTDLLRHLADVVGSAHVLTDPDVTSGWAVDWTGRFRGATPAVIRPADTAEVAEVVKACVDAGAAIVPQGGNTGLVGGSVPLADEIVVSLRRLDHLGVVDRVSGQVTAGAGVSIASLQAHARSAGWDYGVDFAARDSATIGGSVATDAGGLRFVRYGGTRRQLIGVEAVLGAGQVVSHLGGLDKDNTGYDLAGLLCGSEGTLGVVTAARLRLVAPARERVVALMGFASATAAVESAAYLKASLATLEAAELFLDAGLTLVIDALGLASPLAARHPCYLLIECAGQKDPTDALAEVIAGISSVQDVAVAVDASRRAELWRYREAHTEAINGLGPPHKMDVTLPAPRLAAFVDEVPSVVHSVRPGARTWLFGHAADGNIHVNVTGVEPGDQAVDDAVLTFVAAQGGSISAEHGIGTAKRRWLHLNRSPAELDAMQAIKSALDPTGTFNPHVLLPDRS
ncbi:MAG: FAD-binding oxidoreductase [Actinomycetota bacterium]|nr:FAD-binding oxidoreductase [Actinomycetota bacterium]